MDCRALRARNDEGGDALAMTNKIWGRNNHGTIGWVLTVN